MIQFNHGLTTLSRSPIHVYCITCAASSCRSTLDVRLVTFNTGPAPAAAAAPPPATPPGPIPDEPLVPVDPSCRTPAALELLPSRPVDIL